jgi:hypothetical protein
VFGPQKSAHGRPLMDIPNIRGRTIWVGVFSILVTFAGSGEIHGEGLRDFGDGWLLPISDRALILEPEKPPPSGRPNDGPAESGLKRWAWWLGAGQGQLFSLAELSLKSVDFGWRYGSGQWPLSLGLSWERLGEHLYLEDTRTLKMRYGAKARVGLRVRSRRWLVETVPGDSTLEVALNGGITFGKEQSFAGRLDIWLHGSATPRWHGNGGRRTLADFSLLYPGMALALRLDQRNDGVPVVTLEFLGRLIPHVGMCWRMDPETGSMGGGISARVAGLWLQTSHLLHPALGVTHRFYLGAGDPGASLW